jgi:hypothetical protein
MAVSITTNLDKEEDKVEENPFPKLMISKDTDKLLVFFTGDGEGVILSAREGLHRDRRGIYVDCWGMDAFEDYNEPLTITIQNK